jgi:transcriptional regulator of acetoin/glycerol metabolism
MTRISINKASLDFNISRNTLYKHIKQGKITKDADGKLDTIDLVRLYGTHVNGQQESTGMSSNTYTVDEQLKQENQQLKQLLAVNEMLVNQLQQQISDLKQDKENLFNQLDQKRIESKDQRSKRGLLSKLFG